jgi:hypothetical protein
MAMASCTTGAWGMSRPASPSLQLCDATAPAMLFDNNQRPPWLNWLFLAIFLWSSWQLAGMWFSQLRGG